MSLAGAGAGAGKEAELELLLQQELLEHVLRLTKDRGTMLSALVSSKALSDAAKQVVELLVAKQDLLPPAQWDEFPSATRLKISRRSKANDHLNFLVQQMALLPSHVTSIEDVAVVDAAQRQPSPSGSLAFTKALLASACSRGLLAVKLHLMTPAAADIILQGLPRLQHAVLGIYMCPTSTPLEQRVWRPKADRCQELLTLQVWARIDHMLLDLSGLSAATKLQRLAVQHAARAVNITALQALTDLQHLDMLSTSCYADSWAVLAARLTKLATVKLTCLEIDARTPPAASVTHVHTATRLRLQHSEVQLRGCLARQLPQLQHLQQGDYTEPMQLASALQGHPQLRELHTRHQVWPAAAWALLAALPRLETLVAETLTVDASIPAAAALRNLECRLMFYLAYAAEQELAGCLARQLPQLQHLVAKSTTSLPHQVAAALQGHQQLRRISMHLDRGQQPAPAPRQQEQELVSALASCSRLQEVDLRGCLGRISAAVCAALAAGACRESLRVVRLRGTAVDPSCLGPMLRGMPALQRLSFPVSVPSAHGNAAAVMQQVQQVLPAGGMWDTVLVKDFDGMPYWCWECTMTRKEAAVGQ